MKPINGGPAIKPEYPNVATIAIPRLGETLEDDPAWKNTNGIIRAHPMPAIIIAIVHMTTEYPPE